MKFTVIILLLGLLAGCSSTRETTYSAIPQLLIQSPLPDISNNIFRPNFSIHMLLLIDKYGNVEQVKLLSTSGDAKWDSLATASITRWKYSPARIGDTAVPAWIRQTAFIEFINPLYMKLEEILCKNQDIADSVYAELLKGEDFGNLAKKYSIAASAKNGGIIGKVNINQYPQDIRKTIVSLEKDGITKPMKYGDNYIIIKRFKDLQ